MLSRAKNLSVVSLM